MKAFAVCLTLLCVCGAISGAPPGSATRITDQTQLNELTQKVKSYMVEFNKEGFGAHLELIHTHSATVQVVAGVRYVLMADLMENHKQAECKIALWEKPWLNFAKMDIECGNGQRKYSFQTMHKEMHSDAVQSDEYAHGADKSITDRRQLMALTKDLTGYLNEFSAQGFVQLKLVKLNSATVQTMSDQKLRYVIMAMLLENKQNAECKVKLIKKLSLKNYVKMDVECGDVNGQRHYTFVRSFMEN